MEKETAENVCGSECVENDQDDVDEEKKLQQNASHVPRAAFCLLFVCARL